MRNAPLNYLVTIALGCLLWVGTAILAGQQLGDTVSLQALTTSQFIQMYQAVVAGAAALGILGCSFWYFYGSRDKISARLREARRTWTLLFVGQLIVAALSLVLLVILFRSESLSSANLAVIFFYLAMQTVLLFWLCTFLMSPRAVEYIPWGKR